MPGVVGVHRIEEVGIGAGVTQRAEGVGQDGELVAADPTALQGQAHIKGENGQRLNFRAQQVQPDLAVGKVHVHHKDHITVRIDCLHCLRDGQDVGDHAQQVLRVCQEVFNDLDRIVRRHAIYIGIQVVAPRVMVNTSRSGINGTNRSSK